jgi:hypothetical protein
MRKIGSFAAGLGLCLAVLSGTGCANVRWKEVASHAAALSSSCPELLITPLRDWSFRAEGCCEVSYWRCWYKSETMGAVQCCRRVANERDATKIFIAALDHPGGPYPETALCE